MRVRVQHVRGRTEVLLRRGPLRAVSLLCGFSQRLSDHLLHPTKSFSHFSSLPQGGQVSCERLDATCPTPTCSHPARQKGECCPTCHSQCLNARPQQFALRPQWFEKLPKSRPSPTSSRSVAADCEFEQEVHADGKAFVPAGSGPCLKCRCKASEVKVTT